MSAKPLQGYVSFAVLSNGDVFISDSCPTLKACQKEYKSSGVQGYINLALIPESAITRREKK